MPAQPLGDLSDDESNKFVVETWIRQPAWKLLSEESPPDFCKLLWNKYTGYALPLSMALEDMPKAPANLAELESAARRTPNNYREILRLRFDAAARASQQDAVLIFRALAILGMPASCARIAAFWQGKKLSEETVLAKSCLTEVRRCLSVGEDDSISLFHATFAEVALRGVNEERMTELHMRAAILYQSDLEKNKSDITALDMVPYHFYQAGATEIFIVAVNAIGKEKYRLRLWRSYLRDLEWMEQISRRRAQGGETADQALLAATLGNLGTLLSEQGDWPAAKEKYEEALGIRRKLVQAEPGAYLPGLAATLNDFAALLRNQGDWPAAKEKFEEALAIYRKLAQAEPGAYLPNLAGTLNNLGVLLSDQGDWPAAREKYEEALSIYRKLAQAEPAAYLPDLAMTLNNLGYLMLTTEQYQPAREMLAEALQIRRELAANEPRAYMRDLAQTIRNSLRLLKRTGEDISSWPELQQAKEFVESFGVRFVVTEEGKIGIEPVTDAAETDGDKDVE